MPLGDWLNLHSIPRERRPLLARLLRRGGEKMDVLRRGAKGDDVKTLQRLLSLVDLYRGAIDGDFGPKTEDAVRRWQAQEGLVVDGVVGPATWASFERERDTTPSMRERYITPHFKVEEFACNHCGKIILRWLPELCDQLEQLRAYAHHLPLTVSSGYRCRYWNKHERGDRNSLHLVGKAADLHWNQRQVSVDQMARLADSAGFNGIGKYWWGVHVDIRPLRLGKYKAYWDTRRQGK